MGKASSEECPSSQHGALFLPSASFSSQPSCLPPSASATPSRGILWVPVLTGPLPPPIHLHLAASEPSGSRQALPGSPPCLLARGPTRPGHQLPVCLALTPVLLTSATHSPPGILQCQQDPDMGPTFALLPEALSTLFHPCTRLSG